MASITFISFVKMGRGLYFSSVPLILLSQCLVLNVANPLLKIIYLISYFCFVDYKTYIRNTTVYLFNGLGV